MTPDQLRALAAQLMSKVDTLGRKIHRDQTIIEQLTHEIAILKRHRFAKRSEQISPEQGNLLDDLLNTDLEAIDAELSALQPAPAPEKTRQNSSVHRCRRSFHALSFTTNQKTLSALAVASFSASARTSARSSITRQACSRSNNMCVGNGPAVSAKHLSRRRYRPK